MDNNLSAGITLGIIALVSNGISGFLVKIPSKEIGANKLIFYRNIFNTAFLLVIFVFTLNQTSFSLKYILAALFLSIFGYIPMYFFYKAIAIGQIGVISPVSSTSTLITVFLALAIFNEKLTGLQYLSIIIIFTGIVLISMNLRQFRSSHLFKVSSGVPYAIIAAIGWGIWMALIKFPITHLGPYLTSLIVEAGVLFIALFLLKRSDENIKIKNREIFWYIVPVSILMVLWSISFNQGIKVSNVSIVVALSSASPLVVALLGRVFYKEMLSLKQYLGIALITGGIILISL